MKWRLKEAWRIGYAEIDITPPRGRMMSGFARPRYATGTIAPLLAQAVAWRGARGGASLLLAADIIGFDQTTVDVLRHRLGESHGLRPESIAFAASHTHWGPPTSLRANYFCGGADAWLLLEIERKLLAVAREALNDLRAGRVEYTSLETRIGRNRRFPDPDNQGGFLWLPNEQGSYDAHTPVLRLTWRGGAVETIVIVGHACHPTSTGRVDKWSPDYPGAMRDAIQRELGPRSRGVFVMGCGADAKVVHTDESSGELVFSASPKDSRAAGRRLAAAVLTHLDKVEPLPLDAMRGVRCRSSTGELSFNHGGAVRDPRRLMLEGSELDATWARERLVFQPNDTRNYPTLVQSWTFGDDLTIVFMEGEICSPLGPLVRALPRTREAMTVGYAGVTDAYIPSARIVREGGYEGADSYLALLLPAPFTTRVESEFLRIVRRALPRGSRGCGSKTRGVSAPSEPKA